MTHQENNTKPSADFQEGWKLGQQAMLDTVQAHMNELFYPDHMSDGTIPNDTPTDAAKNLLESLEGEFYFRTPHNPHNPQNCPSCGADFPNHYSGCSAIADAYGSQS